MFHSLQDAMRVLNRGLFDRGRGRDAMDGCRCKGACLTSRCNCRGRGKVCGSRCGCHRRRSTSKQCQNRNTDGGKKACQCNTVCMTWRCPCKQDGQQCDDSCSCGTRRKRCRNRVSDWSRLNRKLYMLFMLNLPYTAAVDISG